MMGQYIYFAIHYVTAIIVGLLLITVSPKTGTIYISLTFASLFGVSGVTTYYFHREIRRHPGSSWSMPIEGYVLIFLVLGVAIALWDNYQAGVLDVLKYWVPIFMGYLSIAFALRQKFGQIGWLWPTPISVFSMCRSFWDSNLRNRVLSG